jgi:hypothetical protein
MRRLERKRAPDGRDRLVALECVVAELLPQRLTPGGSSGDGSRCPGRETFATATSVPSASSTPSIGSPFSTRAVLKNATIARRRAMYAAPASPMTCRITG